VVSLCYEFKEKKEGLKGKRGPKAIFLEMRMHRVKLEEQLNIRGLTSLR
jgi:hypothetical protein